MHAPNRHATQNMITKYIEQVFPFHGKPESRSVTKTCIHNQLKSSKAFVVASKNASGDVFYGISPEFSLANLEGTKLPTMVVMPPKGQQQVWPITILRSVTYIWIPVQRAGYILSFLLMSFEKSALNCQIAVFSSITLIFCTRMIFFASFFNYLVRS